MSKEPTVLDYVKSLLTPWRGLPPPIPQADLTDEMEESTGPDTQKYMSHRPADTYPIPAPDIAEPLPSVRRISLPWRALVAIGLALIAQLSLEPGPGRTWGLGLGLYIFAAVWVVWANIRKEWVLPDIPFVEQELDPYTIRQVYMWIGAGLCILAFFTFGGNRFTLFNLIIWLTTIICIIYAFWLPNPQRVSWISRIWKTITNHKWEINISRWTLVFVAASMLIVFFRVYRLNTVPPEMFSDHAEKLLDVWDVLHGQTNIFFPRNTGREGFQMYLTAGVISLIGTGYTFLSLKIGTVLCGILTLPFIYLLGVEIANRRVGLIALAFAGIAYWPNVISRIALRFTLYPFFFAPALYFFLRGIRSSNRNYFILAGLFVGVGLHGYSPYRIVPIIFILAVGLYLLHRQSIGFRKEAILGLLLMGLISLIVFLPLLNYSLANPDNFSYRTLTRVGTIERAYPGSPLLIFLDNLWDAMTMFAWDNGEVWVLSVTHRPALDIVSGVLFYSGFGLLLIRYIRRRHWLDLFLILSIPLLMMPSILSIAFPAENPSLNRTAAALVPVFLLIGLSLDGFLSGIEFHIAAPVGRGLVWVIGILLLVWSGYQNYDLVFNQYQQNYAHSSWNTSEIGEAIKDFTVTIGSQENAYVVAFPHWVDTRLVGINAGFPTKDFAIWPEDFQKTAEDQGVKLFIVKIDDSDSMTALQNLYPEGILQRHTSEVPNKDFYQFIVLPE